MFTECWYYLAQNLLVFSSANKELLLHMNMKQCHNEEGKR